MSSEKRKYELKERAESQQRTRQRIAKAAAELHEQVGPAETTVAEIARRAGVSRLTVYKHFPDDAALYPACAAHHIAENPLPDFDAALAPEDPVERVRSLLTTVYADWYRGCGTDDAKSAARPPLGPRPGRVHAQQRGCGPRAASLTQVRPASSSRPARVTRVRSTGPGRSRLLDLGPARCGGPVRPPEGRADDRGDRRDRRARWRRPARGSSRWCPDPPGSDFCRRYLACPATSLGLIGTTWPESFTRV